MDIRVDWPMRGHEFTEEEIAAVAEVMRESNKALTQGARVQQFEKDFAAYLGAPNAFSLMSAAHGLDIAAMLIEIQPGDEVIIPAHTYCATALAFARRGAVIKWADIRPDTFTASLDNVKRLVTEKTKAIVLVHLYGLMSPETEQFAAMAKEKNIFLVEDCAQSLGAKWNGRCCGTFGDIGVYSFHAQKNLTTLGEGGVINVANPDLARKVAGLRLNGHAPFQNKIEYWLPAMVNVDQDIDGIWPVKSTMNEVQAALGSHLIARLDELTERRRKRSMQIREALKDIPEIIFQSIYAAEAHSHHLLPARVASTKWHRDALIKLLFDEYAVKTIIQFYPLYRYDLFRKNGMGAADVPETDRFFDNMISFPFSLTMSETDILYLIESVRSAVNKLNNR
ncbi:DegT/DnrJ/EryC1/StrS family aminotransferase [Sediminibacterium roseum]|uniref:DegT/DnrJ/EryC1/StrS family aminotransferase n=1 Tax=Sediminibacterium roseum TaxID=1978412 RepID=A0ABW9ZRX4_9BACT|nr:DegT/DnrJ/EryC1/StrS family aminotransferase [Sediminibacterium roseum]NCI49054.1 DegT/DnrJ/EryC1/StrS family aminotransferase [Sediminibacterium roseum]